MTNLITKLDTLITSLNGKPSKHGHNWNYNYKEIITNNIPDINANIHVIDWYSNGVYNTSIQGTPWIADHTMLFIYKDYVYFLTQKYGPGNNNVKEFNKWELVYSNKQSVYTPTENSRPTCGTALYRRPLKDFYLYRKAYSKPDSTLTLVDTKLENNDRKFKGLVIASEYTEGIR